MLTKRAHKYDFEKMFVICYGDSETDVRNKEREGITLARSNDIMMKRVANTNPGGNGPLKPEQKYYFLYVCISETKPTFGYK